MAHDIQVDIRLTEEGTVVAYGTVTVDKCIRFQMQIRKYMDKETGAEKTFFSYPRRFVKDKWTNAVYPDKELQEQLTEAVTEAVLQEIKRDIHLPELEDVTVTLLDPKQWSDAKIVICGLATVKICGLTINGITIKQSEKGFFCNMPQYRHGDSGAYRDSVYGVTRGVQQKITEAVLQAYQKRKNVPESGTTEEEV